jgi:hypothetical protein
VPHFYLLVHTFLMLSQYRWSSRTNVAAEWVAVVVRIQKVQGSNICQSLAIPAGGGGFFLGSLQLLQANISKKVIT